MGYSERGVLNSFLYEIRYDHNGLDLINEFFTKVSFPYTNANFKVEEITILIEQSFSDFGDADTVLLIDNYVKRQTIFVEAKVKTYCRKSWRIDEEFNRFKEGVSKGKVSSSNLFTQLYHKVRLFNELKENGIESLKKGITFPNFSSKNERKIGKNKVVLEALERMRQYTDEAFYIALIPDTSSSVENFFLENLRKYQAPGFIGWNIRNWGFVNWPDIEKFCDKENLKATLNVFKHNKGQIY